MLTSKERKGSRCIRCGHGTKKLESANGDRYSLLADVSTQEQICHRLEHGDTLKGIFHTQLKAQNLVYTHREPIGAAVEHL